MSGIDVRQLSDDDLPTRAFPAPRQEPFRLFLAPEAHRAVWEHAKRDTSVEICGVLVGRWGLDDDGPFAEVVDCIRCENAASRFAEVTFTHESWEQINNEMDNRFSEERIVGWYHSHPDFGIFLSDRDTFIHEHFFANPGQVAMVVDPVRGSEGVFAWSDGKPTPLAHYWVGEAIQTDAALEAPQPSRRPADDPAGRHEPAPAGRPAASTPLTVVMLLVLTALMLGYLLAGQRSRWEQQRLVEGTVAHYGVNRLLRIGLQEDLDLIQAQIGSARKAIAALPELGPEATPDEAAAHRAERDRLVKLLRGSQYDLQYVQKKYSLSNVERQAIAHLMTSKLAARRLEEAAEAPAKPTPPAENDSAAAEVDADQGEAETETAAPTSAPAAPTPPTAE
ncbi:Mov34/MPN/PAD-1 family protein [Pseudobythopirellula maris]|uniref:Mov34/MPN/PAD-1 family protein n=1 Tax=Pseudobythopirellula maris TaxID=2527991 RepID=A0A5C5ZIT3_9BACT|nr:Mov34/MPN/PAD-1 family protein [Pseudobythopirellula maris]TWT87156.1 Mov34/MPN/PAD-1 family protein [Pseudobythopirellula maris]